jgi:hypothetical protein
MLSVIVTLYGMPYNLWMLQDVLVCSLCNTMWLRVPVNYTLLLRRCTLTETDPELAARQAATDDYIIHGDARTVGNRGAGMIGSGASGVHMLWMQMLLWVGVHPGCDLNDDFHCLGAEEGAVVDWLQISCVH